MDGMQDMHASRAAGGKRTKKIHLLEELGTYPFFTLNDFVRIAGRPPAYCWTYLSRLKRDGLVFSIERGKYTVHEDPLVFSTSISPPSYISFWTAMRFHGLTEQLPSDVMVASPRSKKTIAFRGTNIRFFRTKEMWGFAKQRYSGFDIFVADKEKCVIDSLLLKNVPFDEIANAVRDGGFGREMADAAIRCGSMSVMKRLGYMMEKSGLGTGEMEKRLDGNYVPLDWNRPGKGSRCRKWMIIENRRLDDIG
jgi:predicted transcriptional regulator of viral defense system